MKKLILVVLAAALPLGLRAEEKAVPKKSDSVPAMKAGTKNAAELEKEKARSQSYANDIWDEKELAAFLAEMDKTVAGYPKDKQDGYALLKVRCAQCHNPSRPLNSQFVEPDGKDLAAREAAVAKLKKEKPEYFKGDHVWQIEANVWQRYVKRMMAKPGCAITKDEGKKIWDFLVHDSEARKLGQPDKWSAHRKGLLDKLRASQPKRYMELYQGQHQEEKGHAKGGK